MVQQSWEKLAEQYNFPFYNVSIRVVNLFLGYSKKGAFTLKIY